MATDRNTLASLGGGDVFGSSSVLYAALDGGDVIIGPRSKNKSEMHARVINVRVSTEDTGASAQKHPRSGSTCEEVEDRGSEQRHCCKLRAASPESMLCSCGHCVIQKMNH